MTGGCLLPFMHIGFPFDLGGPRLLGPPNDLLMNPAEGTYTSTRPLTLRPQRRPTPPTTHRNHQEGGVDVPQGDGESRGFSLPSNHSYSHCPS